MVGWIGRRARIWVDHKQAETRLPRRTCVRVYSQNMPNGGLRVLPGRAPFSAPTTVCQYRLVPAAEQSRRSTSQTFDEHVCRKWARRELVSEVRLKSLFPTYPSMRVLEIGEYLCGWFLTFRLHLLAGSQQKRPGHSVAISHTLFYTWQKEILFALLK